MKYQDVCDFDGDECVTLADYQLWLECYDQYAKGLSRDIVDVNYTCGRGDNYSDTCLGSYDGGEDIMYELTVTAPVDVDLVLDPMGTTYTGILLDDNCPPDNDCIRTSTNSGSDVHSTGCVHLEPGTYYIMIDTYPAPDCIPQFELTLRSCVPQPGRCCYGVDPVECADVLEFECETTYGGTWAEGLNCTDTPCLQNDTCETATVIPSVPYSTSVDNSEAFADGPPGSCNSSSATVMQNDVFYSYTPTEDCYLVLDVDPDAGVGYDGIMSVYTGPDCDNLTELSCYDPEPFHVEIAATAGTTYWFQVGDWGTSPGGGLTTIELDCFERYRCVLRSGGRPLHRRAVQL